MCHLLLSMVGDSFGLSQDLALRRLGGLVHEIDVGGRDRLVRELTEHDFFGSNPQAADRIKIVATVTVFPDDDPEQSCQWFRDERAVVKWLEEATGHVHPARSNPEWKLCCKLGVQPPSAAVTTRGGVCSTTQ